MVEHMKERFVAVLIPQHQEHLQQEPIDENHGNARKHMEERFVAVPLPQHKKHLQQNQEKRIMEMCGNTRRKVLLPSV